MNIRTTAILLVLILFISACNLPRPAAPSPTPIEANQGQPVLRITPSPKNGLLPANPPVFSPTNTPGQIPVTGSTPMVTPASAAVNCRFGPGTGYLAVGGLKQGASVPVLGKSADGAWWQIQNPNDILNTCWVSASVTNVSGNAAAVPIARPPQASVTLVTVDTPASLHVPGCLGPVKPLVLTGAIDANGPVMVTYHFETQQGGALPTRSVNISRSGPQKVSETGFTPPLVAGTYWVKLFVTAPNSLSAQTNYTITCP